MKRIKGVAALLLAALIMMLLPAGMALADDTATLTVNDGQTIVLEPGDIIAADGNQGIPLLVKGLPDMGAPENGLAGFYIEFTWDPAVINVDSIVASTETSQIWTVVTGLLDNTTGSVLVVGYTTEYSTDDTILLYIGVTAVGEDGASTILDVDDIEFTDSQAIPIPIMTQGAPIMIEAEEILTVTWLSPVATADPYVAQTGSTIPVKLQVLDGDGALVDDAEVTVTIVRNEDGTVMFTGTAVWQPDIPGYKINVSTKDWEDGAYTITQSVDGTSYSLMLVEKGRGNLHQVRTTNVGDEQPAGPVVTGEANGKSDEEHPRNVPENNSNEENHGKSNKGK